MPTREQHLDHADHSGCRLCVAEVGFRRSDERRRTGGAVRVDQCGEFGSVSCARGGAVPLDHPDVGSTDAGCADHPVDELLLCVSARRQDRFSLAVVVVVAGQESSEDPVTEPTRT